MDVKPAAREERSRPYGKNHGACLEIYPKSSRKMLFGIARGLKALEDDAVVVGRSNEYSDHDLSGLQDSVIFPISGQCDGSRQTDLDVAIWASFLALTPSDPRSFPSHH